MYKGQKLIALVPAYNEAKKIGNVVRRIDAGIVDTILVLDDGSTDDTAVVARDHGAEVLSTGLRMGVGAALRGGIENARARGFDIIVILAGNNKDDPSALPNFRRVLRAGYDHVQGSRFLPGGGSENLPIHRWFAIKLLHVPLMRRASGFPYTDTTNGFRGYSRRLLTDNRVAVFRDVFTAYELHYYLAIQAAKLDFHVTEIPVIRRYPRSEKIPTKISRFRGTASVLRSLYRATIGAYDVP